MGERTANRRPPANSVRAFSRRRSYSDIYVGMLTADIVIMRGNASPMRSTNSERAEGQRDCVKAFNLTDARPKAASEPTIVGWSGRGGQDPERSIYSADTHHGYYSGMRAG